MKPGTLTYLEGDATAEQPDKTAIVHICNDVGGWGRGFVLALSGRWDGPEKRYKAWARGEAGEGTELRSGPFALGEIQIVQVSGNMVVANLIGQHDVRPKRGKPPIRYQAVASGLAKLRNWALRNNYRIVMPQMGAGLAGGDWQQIETIVQKELVDHGVDVTVYTWAS